MGTKKIGNITLHVFNTNEELSQKAAQEFGELIKSDKTAVLGLATGSSPVGMYKELIRMHKEEGLDFSEVQSFNLDEYYPIAENDPQSYHSFMAENLFNHININREKTNFPDLNAKDAVSCAAEYEAKIQAARAVDIQILGIGENGHIAFNEPDSYFSTETHFVELSESTRQANARFFNSLDEVPANAISMGIKTIMRSKKIIMIITGEKKAKALHDMICGQIDPQCQASALQLHNNVIVFADEAAAKDI